MQRWFIPTLNLTHNSTHRSQPPKSCPDLYPTGPRFFSMEIMKHGLRSRRRSWKITKHFAKTSSNMGTSEYLEWLLNTSTLQPSNETWYHHPFLILYIFLFAHLTTGRMIQGASSSNFVVMENFGFQFERTCQSRANLSNPGFNKSRETSSMGKLHISTFAHSKPQRNSLLYLNILVFIICIDFCTPH